MSLTLLSVEMVDAIHDGVLNPGPVTAARRRARPRGQPARLWLIADAFDLAAAYAVAIWQGYCFNDGTKRTCLDLNCVRIACAVEETGGWIIRAAHRKADEAELAAQLCARAAGSADREAGPDRQSFPTG